MIYWILEVSYYTSEIFLLWPKTGPAMAWPAGPPTTALHVKQFLQCCQDRQISLNREKWKYCQPRVTFAGFQLSSEGYQIDPAITEAISKFPTPTNRSDLRSFFGLVNQLSSSTDTIAELLSPMRSLLSTKNEFVWSSEHDQALAHAKTHLIRRCTNLCLLWCKETHTFIYQREQARPTHRTSPYQRSGLHTLKRERKASGYRSFAMADHARWRISAVESSHIERIPKPSKRT